MCPLKISTVDGGIGVWPNGCVAQITPVAVVVCKPAFSMAARDQDPLVTQVAPRRPWAPSKAPTINDESLNLPRGCRQLAHGHQHCSLCVIVQHQPYEE